MDDILGMDITQHKHKIMAEALYTTCNFMIF
jgi:hypothetical protein